ncbi:MAG: glutaminyl-peptide cyclotransferase [Eubacteriaceae bacterium]|nr:glutaminyl-peptide cyclotransferase [Eubacteriaceae bacterium]
MIISPETGKVEKILSFAELVPDEDQLQSGDSVMNGIAFDPSSGSLYLTGKNWPVLYRFEFKNIEEFPH